MNKYAVTLRNVLTRTTRPFNNKLPHVMLYGWFMSDKLVIEEKEGPDGLEFEQGKTYDGKEFYFRVRWTFDQWRYFTRRYRIGIVKKEGMNLWTTNDCAPGDVALYLNRYIASYHRVG